jgi:hypothetical protein
MLQMLLEAIGAHATGIRKMSQGGLDAASSVGWRDNESIMALASVRNVRSMRFYERF